MILGRVVLSFTGLLIFLLCASIYIVIFYQQPPLIILNDPVPTDKQVYQPGDRVIIHLEAEIRSQSPSRTFIRWVSGTPGEPPYPVSELTGEALPIGHLERDISIVVVPISIMPGFYRLKMASVYDVHFLPGSQRTVTWYTQAFKIVPAPPPEPRIIIQDVERPIYVFEYIYADRPPPSVEVPSVGGNEPFLVSFPAESPPVSSPPSSNGITTTPESSFAPPSESPKPVVIVIITPAPIDVPPPLTKHEQQEQRREEHKAEITVRQEEHREVVEAKQEQRGKN